ncbi:conserved hypothetical protein [Rhodobacteraceae bacterium KLH11]|nr:conserved hypothetical protein [Rhodobacteraceae bacterium KLH11]
MTGAFVSVIFLTIGIDQIDEDAQDAYVFRPLLVPAILLIWPLVLWRWYVLKTGRDNPMSRFHPVRKAHDVVAVMLAAAIIAALVAGFSVRQTWPADADPVQLSEKSESSK